MGKRGPKPKGQVKIEWSSHFAYAIGLLVTDGCLSPNGRHIIFVSKEVEQLQNYMQALGVTKKIGENRSGSGKYVSRVQLGDVLFYQFLRSIGISPNKTKTIGKILIPPKYFFDFLRGCFDGDGSTYSYYDPRWKSSFMFYTVLVSASKKHISWLQKEIYLHMKIRGHITKSKNSSVFQLKYAKADSLQLLRKMYAGKDIIYLSRKRLKIDTMLGIIGKRL